MRSSEGEITEKSVVLIAMDMLIQILGEGLSEKDQIRKEVISRLKQMDPSASDRALAQRWFDALNNLKKENKISHIPEKLYLIKKPLKKEIMTIHSNLKEIDDVDILKLMVQELWELSIETYVLFYQETLNIIPDVINKDVLYENKDMMRYFLMFIDQILSRYQNHFAATSNMKIHQIQLCCPLFLVIRIYVRNPVHLDFYYYQKNRVF